MIMEECNLHYERELKTIKLLCRNDKWFSWVVTVIQLSCLLGIAVPSLAEMLHANAMSLITPL